MQDKDLKPDIRVLDDGSVGYFYTPQQLEAIRDKKEKNMSIAQWLSEYGYSGKKS